MARTTKDVNTLGGALCIARERAAMSQNDLAMRLGVEQNQVSRWERGVQQPSLTHFAQLVTILQMSSANVLKLLLPPSMR